MEIERSDRLRQAAETGVLRDVDSAHASLLSLLELLKPYRDRYIPEATEVRETISFFYATAEDLLDFWMRNVNTATLNFNYRNLIASYLSAANQLNLTVGREVIH